ncbi:DUF4407 domain-containing protein [Pedobacter alpinus]|uniref:DUF4407 domain-containing protein n=1 Tax=Pedobacter alpinus TaxID=1590643 RepID=A0ABW5TYC2_9SPHI
MIEDFFIWCSGAKKQILDECPIEKGKFVGIGMAVFFVSILSMISSSFFITYAFARKDSSDLSFNIQWEYIACGVLWGVIIFTLDRNIVATIRKTGNFKDEIKKAYPRIFLAFFIGIVVSTPLEMKFFEKEITQKVEEEIRKEQIRQNKEQVIPIENQILSVKSQIKENTSLRDSAYQNALAEKNGNGLTGIKKYGPKAKEWESKSFKYGDLVDSLNSDLIRLNASLMNAQSGISIDSLYAAGVIQKYDGAEARVKALYSLSGFHFVITLLFVALEILPLMVKLMIPRGPYDEILDRKEYEIYIEQKRIISDKNSEINKLLEEISQMTKLKSDTRIAIQKTKLDAEIKANEVLLNDIAQKQANLAKIAVKKWYDTELGKLKQDTQYQYAKTKNIINSVYAQKISDVFWKQKGAVDKIEYYFRNGSLTDNELLYFENDQVNKGKWNYNKIKDEVEIDLHGNRLNYSISELTQDKLTLTDKINNDILQFEKV